MSLGVSRHVGDGSAEAEQGDEAEVTKHFPWMPPAMRHD